MALPRLDNLAEFTAWLGLRGTGSLAQPKNGGVCIVWRALMMTRAFRSHHKRNSVEPKTMRKCRDNVPACSLPQASTMKRE
jgi:hypothetical protein